MAQVPVVPAHAALPQPAIPQAQQAQPAIPQAQLGPQQVQPAQALNIEVNI
jgi:hypothetical protein